MLKEKVKLETFSVDFGLLIEVRTMLLYFHGVIYLKKTVNSAKFYFKERITYGFTE
jgi:hypothetical protein